MTPPLTIAVFSDVHGNLTALEAALHDARQQGARQFWAAGDLTLGGPHPLEVLTRLRELDCRMIRGNSEQYLLDYSAGRFPPLAQTSQQWAPLRWTLQRMTPDALEFLNQLPQQAVFSTPGAPPARVVHGSPRKLTEGLIPDDLPPEVALFESANLTSKFQAANVKFSEVWPQVAEPLFICGHTHIGWILRQNGRLALNPGSTGAPINGDWRAHYALLNWDGTHWQAELRVVPYDLALARRAYETTGLLDEGGAFVRACLLNSETGLNVAWFFIYHVMTLAREAGVSIEDGFPDEVWFEAERSFDWKYYESRR